MFGSVAAGREAAQSDVDLMVIGALGLRELTTLLSGVSEKLGREINPHAISVPDFKERVRSGNHFITAVLKEPKIFLKGKDDELAGLAQ